MLRVLHRSNRSRLLCGAALAAVTSIAGCMGGFMSPTARGKNHAQAKADDSKKAKLPSDIPDAVQVGMQANPKSTEQK